MRITRTWSTALLATAAWAVQSSAGAADEPTPPSMPTVIVWGLLDTPERVPGATSVLSAEEIERLRPYTLHDAFDFTAGVRALDDDIFGRRSGIGIRGAPSRRSRNVLLLEDGTPINASTYLDSSAHYTPPMERLERVEVLKANGQILYGPLNNHGIVNFRNKRPTERPETTLDLAIGDRGTSKQHFMHRRTDGALGTVFAYTRHEGEGAFDVEDLDLQDFYAAAEWRMNERHTLSLSGVYLRERSHYDESNLTPAEYAVAPRTKLGRFGQEFDTIAVDYLKGDVVHSYVGDAGWTVSTKLFVTDLDRPRFTVDPGEYEVGALPQLVLDDGDGVFVPGPDGNGQMISRDRHYRTFGLETRMEKAGLSAWGAEHRLQWGLRAERHRFSDRRTVGEVGEILHEGNRGRLTRDEPYRAWAYSAFLQDEITAGDWTIVPGVRAERYQQRRQRVFPTVEPREEHEESVFLPGISVLYSGWERAQLFASVQRGYTPATARGSDFPLTPEIGINTQVGLRSSLTAGLSIEVAGFYNRLSDTLVQLPFIDPETFASVVINAEDSRAYGADLGVRFDSARLTGSAYNLFAALAYNYTDATFTGGLSKGNRVPEIPLHTGSLTVGVEHARGWHISATLSHEGRFFTDPANTGAPILANEDGEPLGPGDVIDLREPIVLGMVPGRTLLSARASYTLAGTDATIWVQGRNLTDKEYISDYSNGLRPGAPRAVIAGVTVRFRGD